MSLEQLAEQIIDVAHSRQSTMVLVTPPEFSLRPEFFIELVHAVQRVCDPSMAEHLKNHGIEIDCFQQPGGIRSLFADLRAKRQVTQLQQWLDQESNIPVKVCWTAILGRPRENGPIVLGCCDSGQVLPSWAMAVELSKAPRAA